MNIVLRFVTACVVGAAVWVAETKTADTGLPVAVAAALAGHPDWRHRAAGERLLGAVAPPHLAWVLSVAHPDAEGRARAARVFGRQLARSRFDVVVGLLSDPNGSGWLDADKWADYLAAEPFVVKEAARFLGVATDEIGPWEVPDPSWFDRKYGAIGYANVMRWRAIGKPLPYPADPKGPVRAAELMDEK